MLAIPAVATPTPQPASADLLDNKRGIFPINIDVAQRSVETAVLVRGKNNWLQADLDQWLLPLDAVLEALALEVFWVDGVWSVRSPDRTIILDPKTLRTNLDLGLVISAQEIETLFGVPVNFDPDSQTVQFSPPWLEREADISEDIHPALLPQITAPDFTITAIRQETEINSSWDSSLEKDKTDYDGELTALGSLLGGSWFVQIEQSDLADDETWRLQEAQYWHQTDFADFVIGSQPTFWHSQIKKDYLGITTIRRWGFTPPQKAGNGFQPAQRLEAEAAVSGLLPVGASALVVTGGIDREFSRKDNNFLGKLEDFQGGVSYRHGVSEELTLGTGIVYEDSIKGLGELFYGTAGFPFQIQVAALSDAESLEINSNIRLDTWKMELSYDSEDIDFKLDWKVLPGFSLVASGEGDELKTGFRYAYSSPEFSTLINAAIDSDSYFLWKVDSRWGPLTLFSHRRQFAANSELSYNFSGGGSGHQLSFEYETRNRKQRQGDLTTISWQYRSEKEPNSNQRLWEFELGYAFGSHGNGLVTSVATNVVPGLGVRVGYQEVSVASDDPAFKVELVPNFNSSGSAVDDSSFERLRQQGSLWIQPFFDKNNNGRQDFGEKLYTQPNLLLLNDQPLQDYKPEILDSGVFVKLFPATYSLSIDPAQLPPNWTTTSAYEVEVVAGSYTTVLIPLTKF